MIFNILLVTAINIMSFTYDSYLLHIFLNEVCRGSRNLFFFNYFNSNLFNSLLLGVKPWPVGCYSGALTTRLKILSRMSLLPSKIFKHTYYLNVVYDRGHPDTYVSLPLLEWFLVEFMWCTYPKYSSLGFEHICHIEYTCRAFHISYIVCLHPSNPH